MTAGEWLDCEMYSLVPLEIVVAVEALWALVALEWTVVGWAWLGMAVSIHLHVSCSTTVVSSDHAVVHAAKKSEMIVGVVYVCQDGSWKGVCIRTLVCIMRLRVLRVLRLQ